MKIFDKEGWQSLVAMQRKWSYIGYEDEKLFLSQLKKVAEVKKRADHFARILEKLHGQKLKLLQEIQTKARSYQGLREMQLEQEEAHLLKQMEHVVRKEEEYITYVGLIIQWYHGELRYSRLTEFKDRQESQLIRTVQYSIEHMLDDFLDIFRHVRSMLDQERKFIKNWVGGNSWHVWNFYKSESKIMGNFNQELTELFESYRLLAGYVQVRLNNIPAHLQNIQKSTQALRNYVSERLENNQKSMAEVGKVRKKGYEFEEDVEKDTESLAAAAAKCAVAVFGGRMLGERLIGGKYGGAIGVGLGVAAYQNRSGKGLW